MEAEKRTGMRNRCITWILCMMLPLVVCACGEEGANGGSGVDGQPNESAQSSQSPAPSPSPTPTPEVVLGEFATQILDQAENRVNNINIASEYIMQKQLEPGETFSFNAIVGQRTPEKGFRKARVLLEHGEKGYEYGGGICQLSSTMYNAALQAGMEVTERHTHKDEVHYIELGKDAAVSYGGQDFKFVNTKESPVRFRIAVREDMTLLVQILQA